PRASSDLRPEELRFKRRQRWKYIGTDRPISDLDDILTGRAIYGIDARVDGMVYASIERPPVLGGTIRSLDDAAARRVAGVEDVRTLPSFTPPHRQEERRAGEEGGV